MFITCEKNGMKMENSHPISVWCRPSSQVSWNIGRNYWSSSCPAQISLEGSSFGVWGSLRWIQLKGGLCVAHSWKFNQYFLPGSFNKEQKCLHFRNMHSLMLMSMLHETKTISLASDFKGLRSNVEWKYTYGKNDWNSMPMLLQKLFSVLLLLNFTILVALYHSPWGIYLYSACSDIAFKWTMLYETISTACKCCSLAYAKYLWCLKVHYCTVWLGFPW